MATPSGYLLMMPSIAEMCIRDSRARVYHHHGVHHGRRTGRRVYAAQDAVQVLYRYGDGGYRDVYKRQVLTGGDRSADFTVQELDGERRENGYAIPELQISRKENNE